jgi:hypothetical protein
MTQYYDKMQKPNFIFFIQIRISLIDSAHDKFVITIQPNSQT